MRYLALLLVLSSCYDIDGAVDEAADECREIVQEALGKCKSQCKDEVMEAQMALLEEIHRLETAAFSWLGCEQTGSGSWDCSSSWACEGAVKPAWLPPEWEPLEELCDQDKDPDCV